MATSNNTSGLFSRVANFVRSPGAAAASAEADEVSKPAENSAQSIKRVLERKAHNDAVRKREFAQLRKLRQVTPEDAVKLVARPSFFLDSSGFPEAEERASTLRKIDEIEAQMSKQWWKKRQGDAASEPPCPAPVADDGPQSAHHESETLVSFAATLPTDMGSSLDAAPSGMAASGLSGGANANAPGGKKHVARARSFELTGNSVFSVSKMMSVDMSQILSDPTLEDAAVRFANGDDAGAETVLLEAMRSTDTQSDATDTWAAALFDLYRGIGQQQRFELFALDYARRFSRTAPVWFSTPAALGWAAGGALQPGHPQPGNMWVCPAVLDQAALERLDKTLRPGSDQIRLDWRQLKSMPSELVAQLADCLHRCCEQPLLLLLDGERVLTQFLQAQTPVGIHRVDPAWWRARLDALCVLGQQSEFEAVGMDYCITYEVSPPSWRPARSRRATQPFRVDDSAFIETQRSELEAAKKAELRGDLKGDVTPQLHHLSAADAKAASLSVTCEQLVRVDFAAAGSILNWTAARHEQGRQTEFVQVPRLVAAFFSLIGINEHARILVRVN